MATLKQQVEALQAEIAQMRAQAATSAPRAATLVKDANGHAVRTNAAPCGRTFWSAVKRDEHVAAGCDASMTTSKGHGLR